MSKLKEHFMNNLPIYSVLAVCIVITCIALFVTHEPVKETVDTSLFEVVTLKDVLGFFEQDEPRFLVIGYKNCSATIDYVPYLQIAEAKFGYKTYYLELDDIDETQLEDYNKLVEKLNYEYELLGEKGEFGKFIGSTPMTVIINKGKQVFGYIGSMNTTTLETITNLYGVATRSS